MYAFKAVTHLDAAAGHPKVSPDKLHVRFHGFGAYPLDLDYPPEGSPDFKP